ncbi:MULTISPECIES: tetratricopeptide repeat protein [Hymenobacter]|nr:MULTISPECIES: tetratricopeptide repeat protein [Hymenobacter]MBB4600064.1 antitoxin component YwqK of YwqJK toxin-antitoxin module/Tfp pilus assembly protein PilF [Hymenobacter latericoloratus]
MRILPYSTLLGLCAGVATPLLGQQQPATLVTSRQALSEGIALHDKGDYAGAIRQYLLVPSSDSGYVQVQGELALSYSENKQYKEAIEVSQRAIALHLHDAQPYYVLAEAEEALHHEEATFRAYAEGLKRFPYSQRLWFNQGVSYDLVKQRPAALASWQRSLELAPHHPNTHYQLAWLALEQGQTARALISLLTFLALSPDGENSQQALILAERIATNVQEVEEKDREKPFVPNEAFQELDLLITSKVALQKGYQSKVKFDAAIVKQAQLLVEKFPAAGPHEQDLWLRAYGPMVEALRRNDNLTSFTYLILLSAEDKKAAQWVKSNKSKVERMSQEVAGALLQLRAQQPVADAATPTARRSAWFHEGKLQGIGAGEVKDGNLTGLHGPWLIIDQAGAISEAGSFTEAGKRTGLWREYHPNGRVAKEMNYDTEGRYEGRYVEYFDNGALSVEGTYKAGQIVGQAKLYHYCGEVREVRPYQNNDVTGEVISYYPNGKLYRKAIYRADKREGASADFYPDGTPEVTATYAADKRQGPFQVFYPDKTLERKGGYDQDELHGDYQDFHPNGKLASTGRYEHGKQVGRWQVFYASGKPSEERNYDAATGELHGVFKDYDGQGQLITELLYDQGRVTKVTSVDANGKALAQTAVAKKGKTEVKGLHLNGATRFTGTYVDGRQNGEWRWFRRDGSLSLVRRYQAGQQQGAEEIYASTGRVQQRTHYQDGQLQGLYEHFYDHGQLQRTGFYQAGQQQGTWRQYYPTGQLSEEYNLLDNDLHGWTRSYTPGGHITEERWMQYDRPLVVTSFDSTGRVLDRFDVQPTTKSLTLHYANGKPRSESGWLCYAYQGPDKWLYPNGKPELTVELDRGNRQGPYRTYHPLTGNLAEEGAYRQGKREGEWKGYYASGALRFKGSYRTGEQEGEWQYYTEKGGTEILLNYANGELDGPCRTYNLQGELLLEKVYANGELLGFRGPGPDGKPAGELKPAGPISTTFANGKPAATETYQKGRLTGTRTYYYSSGQVFRRSQNTPDGQLTGLLTTYYPNGKPWEEENYAFDQLHGRSRYYRPDGTLEREETYRCGEKAGPTVYYDAQGKPLRTDVYWNTRVYETR